MTKIHMRLSRCKIAGALVMPQGKAPFSRACLLLETTDASVSYLQVTSYPTPREVIGHVLRLEELNALVRAEQAVLFPKALPSAADAALWVLRPSFTNREIVLDELQQSGALLCETTWFSDGGAACLVREDHSALKLRERWVAEADAEAVNWARNARWDHARQAAERAFVLEPVLNPKRIAMLIFVCDQQEESLRAAGYLSMARNSWGENYLAQVKEELTKLAHFLSADTPRIKGERRV